MAVLVAERSRRREFGHRLSLEALTLDWIVFLLFVILVGAVPGGLLGLLVGMIVWKNSDDPSKKPVLLWGLFGAFVGGVASWTWVLSGSGNPAPPPVPPPPSSL